MKHSVALVTTGTEVLTGEVVNTNAAWLAQECEALGFTVARHVVVGDDADAIGAACVEAAARSSIVIVSGGLGATTDDITLAAAARAFGVPLEWNEGVWKNIVDMFARRQRECTPNNRRQAELPRGSIALANREGTAHGIRVALGAATFFFLPGVPRELMHIFSESIAPWLREQSPAEKSVVRLLRCFGLPEASIGQRIEALALPDITVGYRLEFPEVLVKLMIRATPELATTRLDAAEKIVRDALGSVVIGVGEDNVPHVVVQHLSARGETLAVAESCSGGAIADLLTNIPGASNVLERSVVTYQSSAKIALGVPENILHTHGAVSAEVAQAMASAVRQQAQTTYGLAVTGLAGPASDASEHPVGTVFIALATPTLVTASAHCWPMERTRFKRFVAYQALQKIREVVS